MFEFEVLTVRSLDFKDPQDRPVQGMQLWVMSKTQDPAWGDVEVSKLWIPSNSPLAGIVAQLRLYDKISVAFDRRGRPQSITKAA